MDSQVCNYSLTTLNPSALHFYKFVLQEKSNKNSSIASQFQIQNGHEIFEIIEKQFEKLHNPETLLQLLEVLHLTIQQSTHETCQVISKSMKHLLSKNALNEKDYLIALYLLKQFLTSLPKESKVEAGLIDEIIKPNHNIKVQSQQAICICILVDKFHLVSLLDIAWLEILRKKSSSLIMNYIDALVKKVHIFRKPEFWQLIETFLLTDSNRKMAIFSIRKVLTLVSTTKETIPVDKYFFWPGENLLTSWFTYLTILENLEEKQSHLILPALEMLQSVHLGESTPWMRILLQQMLRHKNNLVIRWSVNYLFKNFDKLIMENDILEDFFHATNNTWLYNEKLSFQQNLFEIKDGAYFMKIFAEIPWKSVPMHVWLMIMKQQQTVWKDVKCKLIISTATKIRQLQNRLIRSDCREIYFSIFNAQIEEMDLNHYTNFLDAFYSSSEKFSSKLLSILMSKIEESPNPFLSTNVFMLLSKEQLSKENQIMLIKKLETMLPNDHKWFSVLLVFFFDVEGKPDLYNITNCMLSSLPEATTEFVNKLSWDDVSRAVIRELTVDWFTAIKGNEIEVNDFQSLLHSGGIKTFLNLMDRVPSYTKIDPNVFHAMISELKTLTKRTDDPVKLITKTVVALIEIRKKNLFRLDEDTLCCIIYEYLTEILDIDVTNNQIAFYVFDNCLHGIDLHETQMKLLMRGLLFGEPLVGDVRLEHDYAVRMNISNLDSLSSFRTREICLKFLSTLCPKQVELLQLQLIHESKNMSIRKPRYFENSKHHRLKLRIAQALTILNHQSKYTWNDYYLYAILHENNQTNVTYMYEFIVATSISQQELINQMKSLADLSTSCQSSMFAISFLFCVHNKSDSEFVSKLITLILPWTMGSNFNTRLYAQIAVYHLIKRFKINEFGYLQEAIEKGLKESPNALEKLNSDIRFNFPEEFSFKDIADPILYVTVMPEDECLSSRLEYLSDVVSFKEARRLILLKREPNKEQETHVVVEDVQRKMNPEIDSYDISSKQQKGKHSDMIVVASLIDKLPNLGGIARTCEVLGIKELVLDSVKHTQNKEFKNLSMTAENWINITEVKPKDLKEFLNGKQIAGYEIVGAEQTSNSVNFMEFEFPKKCILLLGHEKEGIPADLIALLDYAVEIPQFGMVRSLNVHVTGALFMYEYCKQRIKSSE